MYSEHPLCAKYPIQIISSGEGGGFAHQGTLAMPGDIFNCHVWGRGEHRENTGI